MRHRDATDLIREWQRCQRADLRVVDLRYIARLRQWHAILRTALGREAFAAGLTPADALKRTCRTLGYKRRGAELIHQPELIAS